MTRINASLSVKNLTDEHLLAEHREIKRVCKLFFSTRPSFTEKRYKDLYEECLNRKFNVKNFSNNWSVYESDNYVNILKSYVPTIDDKQRIIRRITERILSSPKKSFHYYSKKINKQEAVRLLNQ
jgi:prenyltransferase beta subunit